MSAALRLLLVFGWTIGSQCESDVPAAHTVYDKLSIQRNLSKRELKCKEREYAVEDICCKMCPPGSIKQADCTKVKTTICESCKEGLFMDHYNFQTNCRRCQTCDTIFGLEVAEQCTIIQNIKCMCAQDHFCNSSVPCEHCDPCDKCENGAIEKECTSTTNTICKSNVWWIFLVVGVGIVIAITSLSAIAVYCYKKRRQKFDLKMQKLDKVVQKPHYVEMEPLMYTDVDLSTHVSDIVEEMTLPQVKSFVRKYEIPETAIEQILQDHFNDSTEQKIKLFHIWYQMHGMKGAYGNLIRSLRELKMRAVADKIEKKMDVVTSSTQENGK